MPKSHHSKTDLDDIFIVDDEIPNLQLLSELLARAGCQVRPANNPQLAIDSALGQPPKLILLDVRMPEKDGYTASREIRNVPIIAMTAHAMSGDEQRSIEAGMNEHVTKPIDPDQLYATLQKWIKPITERAAVPKSLPASGGPSSHDAPAEPDQALPDKDELPESLPGFDVWWLV